MCLDVNIAVKRGDYLVESSDGTQRIAPREIFEDVYVAMDSAVEKWPQLTEATSQSRI